MSVAALGAVLFSLMPWAQLSCSSADGGGGFASSVAVENVLSGPALIQMYLLLSVVARQVLNALEERQQHGATRKSLDEVARLSREHGLYTDDV